MAKTLGQMILKKQQPPPSKMNVVPICGPLAQEVLNLLHLFIWGLLTIAYLLRSEDSSCESVFSFHYVGRRH